MQGDDARFRIFGATNGEYSVGEIDVAALQVDRLRQAQARCGNQSKKGVIRGASEAIPRRQLPGCGQQLLDLLVGVNMRSETTSCSAQETRLRDLCVGIKLQSILGESAHDVESPRSVNLAGA